MSRIKIAERMGKGGNIQGQKAVCVKGQKGGSMTYISGSQRAAGSWSTENAGEAVYDGVERRWWRWGESGQTDWGEMARTLSEL